MNEIECQRCGDAIEDWMNTRTYGFWDKDSQTYQSHGGITNHYCKDCWDANQGRSPGARIRVDSSEELYSILKSANGKLAGILTWWSGRPAIRVVDGEVQAAVVKPKFDGEKDDGTPILKFEEELIDGYDKERFDDDADPPDNMNIVRLIETGRTAFDAIDPND